MKMSIAAVGIVSVIQTCRLLGADPVGAAAAAAPPIPFEIRTVQRAVKSSAYVENAWKNNVPCIEATIRSTEESPKKRPYVKAYFFNRDKTVVSQHHEPGLVSERGETARIPDYLKPRELYRVYFPVTERAASGKDRWSHVIVVMGEGKRAVAEIYPTDDIATYAFREKAFALYKGKEIVPAAPKP